MTLCRSWSQYDVDPPFADGCIIFCISYAYHMQSTHFPRRMTKIVISETMACALVALPPVVPHVGKAGTQRDVKRNSLRIGDGGTSRDSWQSARGC